MRKITLNFVKPLALNYSYAPSAARNEIRRSQSFRVVKNKITLFRIFSIPICL